MFASIHLLAFSGVIFQPELRRTLGSLGDRIDRAAERREEEKAARERKEKRNKDPWEV